MGILRVGKFVFEHVPAQSITTPAQIITAPAQIITAPAQPPVTKVVVYTALFVNILTILPGCQFFCSLAGWRLIPGFT